MSNNNTKASSFAPPSTQVCTFYVGKFHFGIEVPRVQEVLRTQRINSVPLANEVIAGLINIRGQIVPAIDMRRRLKLEARAEDSQPMNVVLRTEEGSVSLLVDDIGDVLNLHPSLIENPPDNMAPAARELIQSVYKLKDELLLLLDAERTISIGGDAVSV
jgi:purine-binding chemotaxis protein CheW